MFNYDIVTLKNYCTVFSVVNPYIGAFRESTVFSCDFKTATQIEEVGDVIFIYKFKFYTKPATIGSNISMLLFYLTCASLGNDTI